MFWRDEADPVTSKTMPHEGSIIHCEGGPRKDVETAHEARVLNRLACS